MLPAWIDTARALIAADTSPGHGTRAAAEILAPLYRAAGLTVQVDPVGDDDINVIASRPESGDALLLVTHLDTVPTGPKELWTRGDPHTLTVDGDTAYGLGTADVKLDALAKALAAARFTNTKLARPFHLLGTFGEEVGLRGAKRFVTHGAFKPRWVACGEPSELRVINAHKGYCVVRARVRDRAARAIETPETDLLTFDGRAAHSSTPALGVNAIEKAVAFALQTSASIVAVEGGTAANMIPSRCTLTVGAPFERRSAIVPDFARPGSLRTDRPKNLWRALATGASALTDLWRQLAQDLSPSEDARFSPPGAVANVTLISSGADFVEVTLDARLLPTHDPDALCTSFASRAQAWADRLGDGALDVTVTVDRSNAGMALPATALLAQAAGRAARTLKLDPTPLAKPTSTEAGIFSRAGAEAIVFGAGRSTGNAHCANEHTSLSQLERAVDFYEQLIRELCA